VSKDKKSADKSEGTPKERVVPRLLVKYRDEVAPALRAQFQLANPKQITRVAKIVVNMGIGKAVENKARIESGAKELGTITGQKPVITKSKHAVAGFKLREGMPIGVCVTLRGAHMWEFFDRFVSIAVPRIRDFRGLKDKLDGRGSYSVGLSEQSVFPEINLDKVEFVQGMNITFVTTAKNDEQGHALLEKLGVPFRKVAT
jgi:large subunit ribosomal protein L5